MRKLAVIAAALIAGIGIAGTIAGCSCDTPSVSHGGVEDAGHGDTDDDATDDGADDTDDDDNDATTTTTIMSSTTVVTTTLTTTTTYGDGITPGFASIPNGAFIMGSPVGESGRDTDETQHEVTLTNDFEMSTDETTQGEFISLMGWNPSYFGPHGDGPECGDDCPVENVSWYDTIAYANEFSLSEGLSPCYAMSDVVCQDSTSVGGNYMGCMNITQGGIDSATIALNGVASVYDCEGYRIPTESEWEYAIRGGTTTAFYSGPMTHYDCSPLDLNLDAIGWYCGNDMTTPMPVGRKLPNTWGLYDGSGNVREWNWDWYGTYPDAATNPNGPGNGSTRVTRGGSWINSAVYCRSAHRLDYGPDDRDSRLGFRLVRTRS